MPMKSKLLKKRQATDGPELRLLVKKVWVEDMSGISLCGVVFGRTPCLCGILETEAECLRTMHMSQ